MRTMGGRVFSVVKISVLGFRRIINGKRGSYRLVYEEGGGVFRHHQNLFYFLSKMFKIIVDNDNKFSVVNGCIMNQVFVMFSNKSQSL